MQNQSTASMPVMKMMDSTTDVLNRHMKAFAECNLEGILADYSHDAVMFVPAGVLEGPQAIKPLFESLIAEFEKPGSFFAIEQQMVEGDYAYIIWMAETADNWYEFATDTFIVQNGKITAQSFAAKIRPKG